MGMFDEVVCEYPLPDPTHNKIVFQTKDLVNELGRFKIAADGRIRYVGGVFPGSNKHDAWLADLHRDVHIYEHVWSESPPKGYYRAYRHGMGWSYQNLNTGETLDAVQPEWVEYVVRFTEGRVSRVTRVEERP